MKRTFLCTSVITGFVCTTSWPSRELELTQLSSTSVVAVDVESPLFSVASHLIGMAVPES